MKEDVSVNSNAYWDGRFNEDWETYQGPIQSRFFAQIAIKNSPRWFIEQINRESLTFVDWGCAQGDGTDAWVSCMDATQIIGIDFSAIAIQQASLRYPAIQFLHEDWLAKTNADITTYDVIFSSNTLEHFHSPYSILNSVLARAKKALVLALPYKEFERIDEHEFTFTPENIPATLQNGFRLIWSRVIDCRPLPNTLWSGDQILLIYADPSWLTSLKLTLSHLYIEQKDSVTESHRLSLCLTEHDGKIADLEQEIVKHSQHVASLNQQLELKSQQAMTLQHTLKECSQQLSSLNESLEERTNHIVSLSQKIASLDADFSMAKRYILELQNSTSWRVTRPLRLLKRLLQFFIGNSDSRHAFFKSAYWMFPQFLRIWLNPLRHKIGSRRLSRLIQTATVSQASESDKPEWFTLANTAKKILIIPCSFEFEELVNQRPINAAKYYSSKGYFVIFVAWQWTPKDTLINGEALVYENVFQVPLFKFLRHATELAPRTNDGSIYMVTFPADALVKLVPSLRGKGIKIIYDIMDEWECFSNIGQAPWFNLDLETKLVLESDFVTAVSPPLQHKFQSLRNDIVVVGNGYSTETINKNSKFIAKRNFFLQKTVGYFGHLTDGWFDWPLLFQAAEQLPDVIFEIIGYGEPEWVQNKVKTYSNIKMLGKILPSNLHEVAQHWHIGLIPFKKGDLAMAVDPIKIYEYFYFGLPVVVTGIEHLALYPCTYVATTIEEFVAAIQNSVNDSFDKDKIDIFLSQTTWAAQFGKIQKLMEKPCLADLYGN